MRKSSFESLGFALSAAGIALLFALVSIRIWNTSLDVPFEYDWDSLWVESLIKGFIDNGAFLSNSDLGSPYGQDFADFYQGWVTTFLVAMLLGLFTDSWALVTNLIWLAGFALVGATAWWAMHSIGVPRFPAMVAAVLFAILPYHFWRGEAHILLSDYFVVALSGWLILKVLNGDTLFLKPANDGGSVWSRRRVLLVTSICLLIGLGSTIYYAIFSILLLGVISVLVLLSSSKRKAGLAGLAVTALISLFALVSLAPSLFYRVENGTNPEVGQRVARESDYYGLGLSQLIMPATNHRWQELADAKQHFLSETIAPGEDAQSLGLLGTIGLAACLLGVLTLPIGKPRWTEPLLMNSGVAILIAFFLGTVGGGAILIATFLTPQIRAWNRLSIFIGFFALVGFALILARVFSFLEARTGTKTPSLLVGGLLLAFGLWDQTPARGPEQFNHQLITEEFNSDQELVSKMEAYLAPDSQVFQIPYLEYPEGYPPPGTMGDLDPLRGYLHSANLRWSYGAIKGRAADLSYCVRMLEVSQLTRVIKAWGFSALWIDTAGYPSERVNRVLKEARTSTRSRPIEDRSGRFMVFPLKSVADPPRGDLEALRESLPINGSAPQDCRPIIRAIDKVGL